VLNPATQNTPQNAWIESGMEAMMVRRRFDFLKLRQQRDRV
jgi:hypothetical protein